MCNSGLYLWADTSTVQGNTFADQSSTGGGNCYLGGGLSVNGDNNLIADNSFRNNWSYGGGAIGVRGNSRVTNNLIANNNAIYGGGIQVTGGAPILSANTIVGNVASQDGGGIAILNCISPCTPLLTNNIVANNRTYSPLGSAIYVTAGQVQLQHNTLAHHNSGTGTGIAVRAGSPGATVDLVNNIIVSHTIWISVSTWNTATLNATLWGSGAWANGQDWGGAGTIVTGTVNLWGDPAFVDPSAGNYRLNSTSPAVN